MNSSRLALALVVLVAACKKEEPAPAAVPTAAPAVAAAAEQGDALRGKVLERIDVPNYTYLRIATAGGESWAAVPSASVSVGAEVTVVNPMPMEHFESKALSRTFDRIYFGGAVQVDGAAPAAAAAPHAAPRPEANAVDVASIKVAKATGEGAHTVAEVHAQATTLKDQKVVVRGKVVKATNGVLQRNWLHVRDGSGGEADGVLVVTTTDTAAIGDEITVAGVVHTDKDLGSGYFYKVIVEDAKVTR